MTPKSKTDLMKSFRLTYVCKYVFDIFFFDDLVKILLAKRGLMFAQAWKSVFTMVYNRNLKK